MQGAVTLYRAVCEEELRAVLSLVKTPSPDPKPQTSGSEAEGRTLGTALRPPAQAGWFGSIDETFSGETIRVRDARVH